jgi:ABC-type branched-subunit amino acid transport system ATPase component
MARIELQDVSKVYAGGVRAVNALTLDIPDGDFMVFVGPSGCGKSTALRMVAGLEDITEGEIRIGDRVVNDSPPRTATSPWCSRTTPCTRFFDATTGQAIGHPDTTGTSDGSHLADRLR